MPLSVEKRNDPFHENFNQCTCNSYTMACPPVLGDNPRALSSGLPYVQV